MPGKTVCHEDGTVSYWSVHQQQYIERTRYVPLEDLGTLPVPERDRVILHFEKHQPKQEEENAPPKGED